MGLLDSVAPLTEMLHLPPPGHRWGFDIHTNQRSHPWATILKQIPCQRPMEGWGMWGLYTF